MKKTIDEVFYVLYFSRVRDRFDARRLSHGIALGY